MAKDRDDELNKGTSGGEEFSLEEILAEFGGAPRRSGGKDKEDTIPFPIVPKSPGSHSARPAGGSRVVDFPSGRGEAPAGAPACAALSSALGAGGGEGGGLSRRGGARR